MEVLRKLKIELPYDAVILLLGIYSDKSIIQKDTCSTIYNSQNTLKKKKNKPKYPSLDEWIKKMWYIYTREYYSAIERNKIMPLQQHGCN